MDVRLPVGMAKYVKGKVKSGQYRSPDEVVAEALARMQDMEAMHAANTAHLRIAVEQGMDDVRAGRTKPLNKGTVARIRAMGHAKLARSQGRRSA